MDTLLNVAGDNLPQLCNEVGLACETCVQSTAEQVAAVCKGMRGKALGQLFVQLYPNSSCSGMHAQFAQYYAAASVVPVNAEPPVAFAVAMPKPPAAERRSDSERREVTYARPRTMAAYA